MISSPEKGSERLCVCACVLSGAGLGVRRGMRVTTGP